MDRLRDWREKRRRRQSEEKVKRQHKKEFDKCLHDKRDLLLRYGRRESDLRDHYKEEYEKEGLRGNKLKMETEMAVKRDRQLEGIIEKLAKQYKCGDKHKENEPCVDNKDAPNKCQRDVYYEGLARGQVRKWTVPYLKDAIKTLERKDRDEDDEKLLETYRERLETIEPETTTPRRSRNSWKLESTEMALKF